MSPKQFEADNKYLYGLLLSSMKKTSNCYLQQYKGTQDGLSTWLGIKAQYQYDGSSKLRSDELKDKINNGYKPKEWSSFADYIGQLQSWFYEINAIGYKRYDDNDMKDELLSHLAADPDLLTIRQECDKHADWSFAYCALYMREKGLPLKREIENAKIVE